MKKPEKQSESKETSNAVEKKEIAVNLFLQQLDEPETDIEKVLTGQILKGTTRF